MWGCLIARGSGTEGRKVNVWFYEREGSLETIPWTILRSIVAGNCCCLSTDTRLHHHHYFSFMMVVVGRLGGIRSGLEGRVGEKFAVSLCGANFELRF